MKRRLLFLLATAPLASIAQNTCQTALPISAGTHQIDVIDGTEIPDPLCTQTDLGGTSSAEWYTYTPLTDTAVTISTLTAGVDTRFHVYSGSCGALVCVAGDDDTGPGNTSTATFLADAGTTYTIAFDDRWTDAGFYFELVEVGAPNTSGQVSFTAETITGWNQGVPIGVVDMNGDHLDDIVVPGQTELFIGHQQPGGFGQFHFPHPQLEHSAAWSMCAGDLDDNGFTDMLYAGSGVSFMIANEDGTAYTENPFPEFVFCQRSNMADINNDGNLDGFVCHDIDSNVYYLGDGNGDLTFYQGGFGSTAGNYGSIWIDHNNDGHIDLFLSKCAGDPTDQLWENDGTGHYTDVAPALGFAVLHQAWSSAWGDYDNDADMDLLIGNSGGTDHRLWRNDLGSYTNLSAGSGVAGVTGTGAIEWRTHDFNNDGWLDIINSTGLFYNDGDLTFTYVPNPNLVGAIGDLNSDGFLDIMVPPSTLWWNDGNDNNWLTVALEGTVSNRSGIGARVVIVSALGTQIREIRSGDGFRFMSTLNAHFGLREDTEIEQVEVHWPSGIVDVITAPPVNGTLLVVEGLNTGFTEAGREQARLYPNPTNDRLTLSGGTQANRPVFVLDLSGRRVLDATMLNNEVDVSALSTGSYVLVVGDSHHAFAKQ